MNHEGKDETHAWDFRRHCGIPVLAARDGCVKSVVDNRSGYGKGKKNNVIKVYHAADGTTAYYIHIQKGSAVVRPKGAGDCPAVKQEDVLAKVGNVGNSMTGHIHFVVRYASNKSQHISF